MAKLGSWLDEHYVLVAPREEEESQYMDNNGFQCELFDAAFFKGEDEAREAAKNAKQKVKFNPTPVAFALAMYYRDKHAE